MSLNITVHQRPMLANGAMPAVPLIDAALTPQVVALGAQSTAIPGLCILGLIADEDQRISISSSAGYSAPAADGFKLTAGALRLVSLAKGTWYINVLRDPSATATSSPATAWVTGATAQDMRSYGSVEVQVFGLSGGDTLAFTTSNDGVNYVPVNWIDRTLGVGAGSPYSISADQIYSFPGGGFLKWAKTGVASTPALTVRAAS